MSRLMSENEATEIGAGTPAARGAELTVANAVWVAMALLHRRWPEREGFEADEIAGLVQKLRLTEGREDSVRQHIRQHCVANKTAQPNTWCMLFDLGNGLRRLFRAGDTVYPGRNVERTHPRWEDLPAEYRELRRWYEQEWSGSGGGEVVDPLLALIGTWKEEPADEYVARLREGWGEGR